MRYKPELAVQTAYALFEWLLEYTRKTAAAATKGMDVLKGGQHM